MKVLHTERDSIVNIASPVSAEDAIQKQAPWGLARISYHDPLYFDTFKYLHVPYAGKGFNVYIVSSGINTSHSHFSCRASWGVTITSGESDEDEPGLGTHIAGTVAG